MFQVYNTLKDLSSGLSHFLKIAIPDIRKTQLKLFFLLLLV